MAAYRGVYDSHHLQADCQEPGSAEEPYAWYLVWASFYRDSVLVDNTDENSRVFALIQICWVAVSKDMQAVKL